MLVVEKMQNCHTMSHHVTIGIVVATLCFLLCAARMLYHITLHLLTSFYSLASKQVIRTYFLQLSN